MKTNVIGLVLFGLITFGLATGGYQYFDTSQPAVNVDDTTLAERSMGEVAEAYDVIGYEVDPVMVEDEVLAIADSLDVVIEYKSTYVTETSVYFDGYGLWTVEYSQIQESGIAVEQSEPSDAVSSEQPIDPYYEFSGALYVWIDDATGTVVDTYVQEPYVPIDPEVLQDAIDFLFPQYISDSQDMFEIYGDQYGNEVYVSGYNWMDEMWFSASLFYENNFELRSLSANFEFGSATHNLSEAEAIVLSTPEGQNLTAAVNITSYVSQYLEVVDGVEYYSFYVYIYQDWGYGVIEVAEEPVDSEIATEPVDQGGDQGTSSPGIPVEEPGYAGDEYYVFEPTGYLFAEVDDATGDIVYLEYNPVLLPESTEEEVISVALADPTIKDWIASVDEYESYAFFYNGYWEVSLNTLDFTQYAYVQIEDSTLDILYVYAPIPQEATHSENEIRAFATANGLSDFIETNPDAEIYVTYDGFGTWYVEAISPVFLEEYLFMEISDADLELVYIYESHMEVPPQMTIEEVKNAVMSTQDYKDFMLENPSATMQIYYYFGMWFVDVYDENSYSAFISFAVDDLTGEVSTYYGYAEEPVTREG